MFNRSQGKQGKQQGFAKEQRIADAQLASLKQLGLIGRDKKGFASAWGGTEPITTASGSGSAARTGPNYTTIKPPGDPDNGPSFPEKGELSFSLSLFPKTFPQPHQAACRIARSCLNHTARASTSPSLRSVWQGALELALWCCLQLLNHWHSDAIRSAFEG